MLGTFVLRIQYIRPQYSVYISPIFGTFFQPRILMIILSEEIFFMLFSSLYKECLFLICRDVAIATSRCSKCYLGMQQNRVPSVYCAFLASLSFLLVRLLSLSIFYSHCHRVYGLSPLISLFFGGMWSPLRQTLVISKNCLCKKYVVKGCVFVYYH